MSETTRNLPTISHEQIKSLLARADIGDKVEVTFADQTYPRATPIGVLKKRSRGKWSIRYDKGGEDHYIDTLIPEDNTSYFKLSFVGQASTEAQVALNAVSPPPTVSE